MRIARPPRSVRKFVRREKAAIRRRTPDREAAARAIHDLVLRTRTHRTP